MARRSPDPDDPVLVVIEDEPMMTFDEWLALVSGDEPTDVDAGAADTIREIRDQAVRSPDF